MIASGTDTPGTSFARNSALRTETSGQIPAMIGMCGVPMRVKNSSSCAASNTGCVIANSAPASTFHSKRWSSCAGIDRDRIHADADREARRLADRVAARIEAVIQVADEIRQSDRVDVEHRGRVGIRSHLRRIAGDDEQIAEANGRRAQQVAQHAEQVAIAAGVVGDGLDADLLFDQHARHQRAHAALRARAVGHVHRVDAGDLELAPCRRACASRRRRAAARSPPTSRTRRAASLRAQRERSANGTGATPAAGIASTASPRVA